MKHLLTLSLCFLALSLSAQTCMTAPADFIWECNQEDNGFIYLNSDGVVIHDCLDPSIIYELTMPIDVAIEELGCVSETHPGVLRRITRTFVYETGNPLDVSCPSYGAGFICATQVIEVRDVTAPTFSLVQPNVEIECNVWNLEDYFSTGSFGIEFYDNCETPTVTNTIEIVESTVCSVEKSIIWTFTLTDACGNSAHDAHVVNVVDTTDPEIIFSPIISDAFNCIDDVVWPEISASDMCSSATAGWDGEPNIIVHDCPNNLTLTRQAFATDACGNQSEPHTITITVEDTEAPTITLPTEGFEIECGQPFVLEDPVVEDNCDSETIMLTIDMVETGQLSDGNLTSTTIYTATDACGNSLQSEVVVNIVDTQSPYFTSFPPDLVLACGENFTYDIVSFEDACDPDAYLGSDQQFDFQPCANNTLFTRTFIISDNSGNEATQTQSITFLDEDPPIILTPLDPIFYQFVNDVPDCMEIFEGLEFGDCSSGDVVLTDCSDVVVAGICAEQDCTIERTYYFADACGNQGSANQTITVDESILGVTDLEANRGKSLIMFLDVLGREVNYTTNQILFHVYDDGSVEKKFVIE